MRRDYSTAVAVFKGHPPMTEESNIKMTYIPGKGGGPLTLPMGAKLIVPEGLCSKRDAVTCRVVPPSFRWEYDIPFPEEHIISEIFILSGNIHLKQKPALLLLPYNPQEGGFMELNVKGLWKDEDSWADVGFIPRVDAMPLPCVELELERLGTFVVTWRNKTDPFEMSPNGGLFHCRLNRNLTVRFPKKAVDTTINFTLKVIPITEERIAFAKEHFQHECADLVAVTEFYDLSPDVQCTFKRDATIKLPLPEGLEVEGEDSNEIVVLHNMAGTWEWVDTKYKFSRKTVTFDIKNPTKFCVVKTKPERERKMQEAVSVLEDRVNKELGEVSVFLSLQPKSWAAVVECYPKKDSHTKLMTRKGQGYQIVKKVDLHEFESSEPPRPVTHGIMKDFRSKHIESFEIFDGLTWSVEVCDDLITNPEGDLLVNDQLKCYKHLKESYRRFLIQPAMNEERELKGTIKLVPDGVEDPKAKEVLTLIFHLDIPLKTVTAYHATTEPKPELVKPKPKPSTMAPAAAVVSDAALKPAIKKDSRSFSTHVFERLTQAKKSSVREREPKVLSGKSLMALSKVVNEGLSLAVHLELPESTITGIGFDALANGLAMEDISYRILQYWKRNRRDTLDDSVQRLIECLRNMGMPAVAAVVEERHRDNRELSTDCFVFENSSAVDLPSG